MEAHVRTLDQLPTAVAMFDAKQRLVFHNAAYRQLWGLDPALLEGRPSDGEILDRLRGVEREGRGGQVADGGTLRVVGSRGASGGVVWLWDGLGGRVRREWRYNGR